MNSIRAFWESLGDRDRRSLIIFAVFIVVVCAYLVVIEPIYLSFEDLNVQKKELTQEIEKNSQGALSLYRRKSRLSEVREENEYLFEKLDIEERGAQTFSDILQKIKLYGREAGVSIDQITPLEHVTSEERVELPFIINVSGDFMSTSKFLYYLETSPQVFVISDLHMQSREEGVSTQLQVDKISMQSLEGSVTDETLVTLRIGLDHWMGYAPFYIADKLGWLKGPEVQVRLVWGADTDQLEQLVKVGDLDGVCLPLSDHIALLEAGHDIKAIAPLAWSAGNRAIVVTNASGIKNSADLAGTKIHGQGRVALYLLYQALLSAGLDLSSVELRPIDDETVLQSLSTGLIKAGVLEDPHLSIFFEEDRGRKVFSSKDAPHLLLDLLVVNEAVLENKHDAIVYLLTVLQQAQEWIAANPEEAAGILADLFHMREKDARKGLENVLFLSISDKRSLVGCTDEEQGLDGLIASHERFLEALYGKKISLPQEKLFDWSALRTLLHCSDKAMEVRP